MAKQLALTGASSKELSLFKTPGNHSPTVLTSSEFEVMKATVSGSKIGEMHPETLTLFVVNLMNQAKIRLGQTTEFSDSKEVMRIISDDLRKRYYGFTSVEIASAVERGLNGEFRKSDTEIIVFTPVSIFQWVKAYKESVKEPIMKKALIQHAKDEEKPIPSLAEQNAMLLKGLYAHIEKMKADPSYAFSDFGNAYHSFLHEIGIKLATKERRWKIYEEETQAMKLRLSEISSKKAKKDWLEALDQLEVNSAKEARQLPGNEAEMQVIIACKKRVVLEWIRECLEFSIEPSELIEEKCSNL